MALCPTPCGKQRYASAFVAQMACIQAAMRGKPDLIWYRSGACRCWHLSNPSHHERGKGGRRGQWVRQFAAQSSGACGRCGAPLPPNAGFCGACGGPIGQ